jgi:lipoprotein signal peptidase
VAYHPDFWLIVGAAAPVLALAHVVVLGRYRPALEEAATRPVEGPHKLVRTFNRLVALGVAALVGLVVNVVALVSAVASLVALVLSMWAASSSSDVVPTYVGMVLVIFSSVGLFVEALLDRVFKDVVGG